MCILLFSARAIRRTAQSDALSFAWNYYTVGSVECKCGGKSYKYKKMLVGAVNKKVKYEASASNCLCWLRKPGLAGVAWETSWSEKEHEIMGKGSFKYFRDWEIEVLFFCGWESSRLVVRCLIECVCAIRRFNGERERETSESLGEI